LEFSDFGFQMNTREQEVSRSTIRSHRIIGHKILSNKFFRFAKFMGVKRGLSSCDEWRE